MTILKIRKKDINGKHLVITEIENGNFQRNLESTFGKDKTGVSNEPTPLDKKLSDKSDILNRYRISDAQSDIAPFPNSTETQVDKYLNNKADIYTRPVNHTKNSKLISTDKDDIRDRY